jgi:hypothetical protein
VIEFKPIPSRPGYLAGSDGSIIGRFGRPRKLWQNPGGYLTFGVKVGGSTTSAYVHTAVCEAFHGPKPTPDHQVAHDNGIKTDNRPVNLAWKTPAENQADRRRHGTHLQGEQIFCAKLTEDDVREIRKLGHLSQKVVGRLFGVHGAAIGAIRSGRTWKHVKDHEGAGA